MRLPATGAVRLLALLVAVLSVVTLSARQMAPLPDLVVVVLVAVGLRSGVSAGLGWGLAAGWLADLVPPGGAVLGLQALLYAAAGALCGGCHRQGRVSVAWIGLVALVVGGSVEGSRILLGLAAAAPVDWGASGVRVALTASTSALVVPVLLRLEGLLLRRGLA